MAKVISFKIQLEGSKDVLKEIDKIGKALTDKLKGANIKLDDKAFDDIAKSTAKLKDNVSKAGTSITEMTKKLTQLRSEGKQNTAEYQNLTKQVATLKNQQAQTNAEVKKGQATLKAQANLQRLLNGEIKAGELSQKEFFAALNSGLDKADPKYQELIGDFAKLKQEEKAFRDGLRKQQQAFQQTTAAAGSYRALNAELVQLRASYKELSETERNGATGKAALKRIQKLDTELKKLDKDVGQFQRNVGNYASAWRGVSGALSAVGISVGASELISGIKQLVGESTQLFDIQERADAQLQAALTSTEGTAGRTLEQLKAFAQERQKLTLFGDEETQAVQSLLLTFTNIQDDTFDRTTVAVQDYATALATATGTSIDTRSASIQLGKALNDPIKGLTALGRSGVQFSEDQKTVIAGFVETGNLAEAQNLILQELERQFAGSAEAAAKAGTGATKQLQNQISDVKETIGKDLAPALEAATRAQLKFFQVISEGIPKAIAGLKQLADILSQIPKFIKENAIEIGALALALLSLNKAIIITTVSNSKLIQGIRNSAIVQKALSASTKILTGLQAAYSTVTGLLTGKIKLATLATQAQAAIQAVLNKVMKANPIGLVVAAVSALVFAFTRLYKSSQTLRSGLAGTFNGLKKIVGNVVGGIVKQLTGFGQLLKGVFTLNLDDIKAGAKKYTEGLGDVFLRAGEGAGDAFNKGFNEKTAKDLASTVQKALDEGASDQLADEINNKIATALEKGQITNAQADEFQRRLQEGLETSAIGDIDISSAQDAGEQIGGAFGQGLADGIDKTAEKAIEARKKALDNIRKLEAELITDEFDASTAKAETSAESDIAGLVGDPEQIRKQTALINAQLALSISEIEQKRVQSFSTVIERAKQAAANEIALLTGSPNEIAIQSEVIKQALVVQIEGITDDRNAAISNAIAQAEASKDAEIAALTGSPEEIEANAVIIRQTYSQVISDLTETRKGIIAQDETEIATLRRQIVSQFGGEITEDLRGASLAELQIAKDTLDKKLALLDEELQREQQALRAKAALKKQQLSIELQSGVSPERAQEIANQLEAIDNKLKQDLLKSERDLAKKRLDAVKAVVPQALTEAERLAQAEIAVNQEKNDEIIEGNKKKNEKLLADDKARAEAQKALEKQLEETLIDGAFQVAGAFTDAIIQGEKDRVSEQFRIQQEKSEAQAEATKASTKAFYETQIAEAEGDTEKQEALQAELASKLVQIDENRATQERAIARREAIEQKKIARKQALINGALAVTRALAFGNVAQAVAAGIAVAAQLITIESQKFEKGGALSNGLESFIVDSYELGGNLGSLPDVTRSSKGIPTEGITRGKRHKNGGIPARFNNTRVELEGGEYKLRNGPETYFIHRKATKAFKPQLDSLKGNPNKFDPAKRIAASNINAFRGNGVKFAAGGALGVGAVKPIPAPVRLQSVSGSVTREELSKAITGVYSGLSDIAIQIDRKTDTIATEIQSETAAINSRIDRLIVYTDPADIVNKGNERIAAQTATEL